jgi:ankyrin repeat protein
MLAASVDCAEGVQLLLDSAASLELQDALGRTALMFAAGNNARAGLEVLLDRGASVSIRDRCALTALGQQWSCQPAPLQQSTGSPTMSGLAGLRRAYKPLQG